jgi:ferrous iron transport protein B
VFGTVYAIGNADAHPGALATTLQNHWSIATGLAFLAWYVFAPQCASTIGVVKRETNSWLWPAVMLVYMTALAYVAALIVYQVARLCGLG